MSIFKEYICSLNNLPTCAGKPFQTLTNLLVKKNLKLLRSVNLINLQPIEASIVMGAHIKECTCGYWIIQTITNLISFDEVSPQMSVLQTG